MTRADRRNASLALLLLGCLMALSPACEEGGEFDPDTDRNAALYDGPALKHPREMTTAATLFADPIARRAHRLEARMKAEGPLDDPRNLQFLVDELRGASIDLDAVDASEVVRFRQGERADGGAWLMASIGPDDASRRILVTRGREARRHRPGFGSTALELAVFLETLRICTIARAAAETPSTRVAFDFVLVPGAEPGYDFIPSLPSFEGRTVGLLSSEDLLPAEPQKRFLLGRVSRRGSILARCLESVLADFSGQPAAWGDVGLEFDLAQLDPDDLAERDDLHDAPRAILCGASGDEGRALTGSEDCDERIKGERVPALHPDLGTDLDQVDRIGGPGLPLALASARALALVLLRCEASLEAL